MRILVTGGAGFIGSHVVERLLVEGHSVTVLDSFDPFYPPEVKRRTIAALLALAPAESLTVYEGDIRNQAEVVEAVALAEPDAVVHLAALAGVRPSCLRPTDYMSVNVTGTTTLLEAIRAAGVRRFVFASSSSVYGETAAVPFQEEDACGCPISPYAATKRAGELICHSYAHLYGMRIICARLFTVYGPRQRPDLAIHKFCDSIAAGRPITLFGDGTTRRDYTYVSDIVEGLCRALDWTAGEVGDQAGGREVAKRRRTISGASAATFEVVNLGGGQTTSLIDLVRQLEKLVRRPALLDWQPAQPGDVPITYADTSHAKALLGYEPSVSIEHGLAQFVDWFRREQAAQQCEPVPTAVMSAVEQPVTGVSAQLSTNLRPFDPHPVSPRQPAG